MDRLWQASIAVEPYRVPGFAFGVPLLEPVVKGLIDLWSVFAAKVLLWPIMRSQRTTNALLSRMIIDSSLVAMTADGDDGALIDEIIELRRQIQALSENALDRRPEHR